MCGLLTSIYLFLCGMWQYRHMQSGFRLVPLILSSFKRFLFLIEIGVVVVFLSPSCCCWKWLLIFFHFYLISLVVADLVSLSPQRLVATMGITCPCLECDDCENYDVENIRYFNRLSSFTQQTFPDFDAQISPECDAALTIGYGFENEIIFKCENYWFVFLFLSTFHFLYYNHFSLL